MRRRLTLRAETLHGLETDELREVAGAASADCVPTLLPWYCLTGPYPTRECPSLNCTPVITVQP